MYEAWKEKERKIEQKRNELLREEENMYRLAPRRESNCKRNDSQTRLSTVATVTSGKEKERKQQEMQKKLFEE